MKYFLFNTLLFISVSTAAQSYKPSVNLAAGKKYTVVNTSKGNMSQELMGQTMELPVDVVITSLLEVRKAADKEFQLSSTTTRMVMSMSAMGQDMNYDSDKKEDRDGPLGQAAGEMVGKPTAFTINHFGKIKEGSIVKSTNPEKETPGGNMMMGMMPMDAETQISQAVNLFVSDMELKVGDSYTDSSTSADGKDKKNTVYTLVEVKDGMAKFTLTGTAQATNEMELQGMQTVTSTTTKTTGEMWVTVSTGLLAKMTQQSVVTGTIQVAGMSVPLSGNNTTTITVAEAAQ